VSENTDIRIEIALLGLLALLWGSSYLFIKIAVADIPPLTLIAIRVTGAALFLLVILRMKGEQLPRDPATWRKLSIQSFLNSIGAWTVLAWGQQFVDAGLASVLNSTSPIFVVILSALILGGHTFSGQKAFGACLGLAGVIFITGPEALQGLGSEVAGQLACLLGAALYAGAAIYGRRFNHIGVVTTAAGTMMIAAIVLIPIALFIDKPWLLNPGTASLTAAATLSILCTGVAMLIYFRLIRTLGSLGTASQSYLRAGVGVLLGMVFLGETMSLTTAAGLCLAIAGVACINWPRRSQENK